MPYWLVLAFVVLVILFVRLRSVILIFDDEGIWRWLKKGVSRPNVKRRR
jgi:hypothetical protein